MITGSGWGAGERDRNMYNTEMEDCSMRDCVAYAIHNCVCDKDCVAYAIHNCVCDIAYTTEHAGKKQSCSTACYLTLLLTRGMPLVTCTYSHAISHALSHDTWHGICHVKRCKPSCTCTHARTHTRLYSTHRRADGSSPRRQLPCPNKHVISACYLHTVSVWRGASWAKP